MTQPGRTSGRSKNAWKVFRIAAEYGFSWFLNSYRGHSRMWHYGETVGFRTAILRFPDDRLTVVILCNRSDLNPAAIALKIADLYFGK